MKIKYPTDDLRRETKKKSNVDGIVGLSPCHNDVVRPE